jgi:ABC-type transporter Mla MlaB component
MGSSISWQETGDGGARVVLSGRLTIDDVATLADELAAVPPRAPGLAVDLSAATAIDTAGAWAINSLINRWNEAGHTAEVQGAAPDIDRLIRALTVPPPPVKRRADRGNPVLARLAEELAIDPARVVTAAAPSICPPCTRLTKNTSWMPARNDCTSDVMRPMIDPSFAR